MAGASAAVLLVSISILLTTPPTEASSILWINDFPSPSYMVFQIPLIEELSRRGHNVTVISYHQHMLKFDNITKIPLQMFSLANADLKKLEDTLNKFSMFWEHVNLLLGQSRAALTSPEVTRLITAPEGEDRFDLIVMQPFYSECFLGFAHKFGAPLVYVSTNTIVELFNDPVGNPFALPYVPNMFLDYGEDMSLQERLHNAALVGFAHLLRHFVTLPTARDALKDVFGVTEHVDPVRLQTDAALFLVNSHPTLDFVRPLTPNTVEVGGMHIRPVRKLPADLKEYLDDAQEGAIFFSLGSNMKSEHMNEEVRNTFLHVFASLKQRVLWKWDQETMPSLPPNVHLGKWLPQSDILGHKNVKLFISHGGKLSIQEAIYHGVPILGIPLFVDQKNNMRRATFKGFAERISYENITRESLHWAVNEILNNPRYTNCAQKLSLMFKDQPKTSLQRAVNSIEYVLRHEGTQQINSYGAQNLDIYQYFLVDIIAVFLFAAITSSFIIKYFGFPCVLPGSKSL